MALIDLLPALPACLLLGAAATPRFPVERAAWLAVPAAVSVAFAVWAHGSIGATLGPLGLHADALTAVLVLLVAFVGAVVTRYGRTYLDGSPGQPRFMRGLALTLAAVLLLIVSGTLVQFALAWVATSLCLHRLLLFFPERPAAQRAARKKFVFSRIGDLCVVSAFTIMALAFGTIEVRGVLAAAAEARSSGVVPAGLGVAGLLLAIAALLKSAQMPFHGWLTEVMETPTPVSALLHAGIVNAGGFLVVRFAEVLLLSGPALPLLAIVGGATAVLASIVVLAQTSVKVSLAWSTVAQMGFMLLQCGLGAFPLAVLHIVAHGLYKAHAFLSAGEVARSRAVRDEVPLLGRVAVPLGLWAGAVALGAGFGAPPATVALGAVLAMGLAPLWRGLGPFAAPAIAGVLAIYGLLQAGAAALLAGTVPTGPGSWWLAGVVIVFFAGLAVLEALLPGPGTSRAPPLRTPASQALRVHAAHGFYLNTLADRAMGRLWPFRATARTERA